MIKLELKQVEHSVKVGDLCEYKEPNILEDTLFMYEGSLYSLDRDWET